MKIHITLTSQEATEILESTIKGRLADQSGMFSDTVTVEVEPNLQPVFDKNAKIPLIRFLRAAISELARDGKLKFYAGQPGEGDFTHNDLSVPLVTAKTYIEKYFNME